MSSADIDYLKLYISKHLCNRIKQEVRKKTKVTKKKAKNQEQMFTNYGEVVQIVSTISKERLINYMYNKYRMNKIDYTKKELIKGKKIDSSIQLEILRQEEKLANKFVATISHANINLTHEKSGGGNIQSIDVFGSNKSIQNIPNDEYKNVLLNDIRKYWLMNSKIVNERLSEGQIINMIDDIVELRSYVIHKKKKLKKEKEEIIFDSIINNDYEAYKLAILEKYLSNNVFKYYTFDEVSNIIESTVKLNSKIIEENYIPRFYKVFKEYVHQNNLKIDYMQLNVGATKFIMNQLYNNQFKIYMMDEQTKIDCSVWENILDKYEQISNNKIKENENLDLRNKNTLEAYKYISQKVSAGNYEEYMQVWRQYIYTKFINYVEENHPILDVKSLGSQLKEKDVNVEGLKLKIKEIEIEVAQLKEKKTRNTIYLLTKLCNRKEANELENALRAYYQFITQEDVQCYVKGKEEDYLLFKTEELKTYIDHIMIAKELIDRNVEVLLDNQAKEFSSEVETGLKNLIKNFKPSNLEIYKDEKNIIQFKQLRFLEQQNTIELLPQAATGIIKQSHISSYEDNKSSIIPLQVEVSELLKEKKQKIVKRPRHSNGKYYDNMSKQERVDFIKKWNHRNKLNFEINTVELYTIRKLHNFTVEVHALYVRTMKAIERDFILLTPNSKLKFGSEFWGKINNEDIKNIYSSTNIDEKLKSVEEVRNLRNAIAHFNYYNKKDDDLSLFDIYNKLYQSLTYNNKRKKAFKLSLYNIFDKYGMQINISVKNFIINSKKHQYAYKTNCKDEFIWKRLYLITKEEVKLFEKAFIER